MTASASTTLPDSFVFNDGARVESVAHWRRRRAELHDRVIAIQYGGMPPASATNCEVLHTQTAGTQFITCRISVDSGQPFSFIMTLLAPPGEGPFPVVLCGDACWRYVNETVTAEVLGRNAILALFNRVEIAPDVYRTDRTSGLYPLYPDLTFGALSAWAWGYHRCVDVLTAMPLVDPDRIAIVGHSRGGKAVLLAGATDERIALTAPNNSGSGGAGCYRFQGPESETLADTMRMIPYWFGPLLADYVGRETELPFDQHDLKALVAPRALLSTEALADLWANPTGTWRTHLAAREVYHFLGAPDRIGIAFRDGEHRHGLDDWRTFLDFMDWQFHGRLPEQRFDRNPFPDLTPAHDWSAPEPGESSASVRDATGESAL